MYWMRKAIDMWLCFALASAVFAGATAVLSKCGVRRTDSDVATAVRTGVVLVCAWDKGGLVKRISRGEAGFLVLSGLCTGASWVCYFRALQTGPASAVAPVDQLSILVSVAFSALVLGEKITRRAAVGLVCLAGGILCMLI